MLSCYLIPLHSSHVSSFEILFALLSFRGALVGVANGCLNDYMRGVRKGGLFSTSSSACGLVRNLLALGLDDLPLWPAELIVQP